MRTIRNLINKDDTVYILVRGEDTRLQLIQDAVKEGFFDGKTMEYMLYIVEDIVALSSAGQLLRLGWAGHVHYHNKKNKIRVDYRKYIQGDEDYLLVDEEDDKKVEGVDGR